MSPRRAAPAALALAAALVQAGCILPKIAFRTGSLPEDAVGAIRPGQTTKAELIDALGPPMAIAAPGEEVPVRSPLVYAAGHAAGGRSFPLQADAALELFVHRRPLGPDDRLYYWYATKSGGYTWFWILPVIIGDHARTSTAHLWVVLDESTEKVVDLAVRRE